MRFPVTIRIGGRPLRLDLRWRHERRYAASYFLGVRFGQADIDRMLFERFIRPGDRLLDAGANIGLCSLQGLEAGCSAVHAIEPAPVLFERLSRIAGDGVVVHPVALSDHVGEVVLTLSVTHNQGSTYSPEITSLFPEVFGRESVSVTVPCTTLDALDLPPCEVWKIDVEGAEVDVLRGASRTLAEKPPRVILAEVYEPAFEAFRGLLAATHPVCRRAFIDRKDHGLVLVDPATAFDRDRWLRTSPMYVFEAA